MDTTLRDGEQTSGVSFGAFEKLSIARLLLNEIKVNRIEIASARVSAGEMEAVKRVCDWASKHKKLKAIEVLGFIDKGVSINWIKNAGGKIVNMLSKGSLRHCQYQLKKSPEEHICDIKHEIDIATKEGIEVNLYLEDWSNGMKDSPEYVYNLIDSLSSCNIKRFMLPDTLGVLNPDTTYRYCKEIIERYPTLHFDFHAHNDYDLAVANCYAAVKAGVKGVHCTINGLGERAGNAALSSILAVVHDQLGMKTSINEAKINHVSRVVESYSGIRIPANKPVIGDNVFTQCAGVHADGDSKNNLYYNDLLPERFGRMREYALGKTSGKANIRKNLEAMGIELDEESMRKVTERIIELGDKKEIISQEDLPYIISDTLNRNTQKQRITLLNYTLAVANGLRPGAVLKLEINGEVYEAGATGDGQYDAFVKGIQWIYKTKLHRPFPQLLDYAVNIPPGGRTDALVQTSITWEYKGKTFKTYGLDLDQMAAAIQATIKMLNHIEEL
ncbi:MAG: 2-isopropylmalate synthase [Muribaculaceae bacterium]|nr:2-isopropylmalate synthase [Muribaculaceae bacterium]